MKSWKQAGLSLIALACLTRAVALPSFDPFANATASGGTAYANGAALYHQTNALGESWSEWNGGTTTSWVACTNSGLSYGGFPYGFPAPALTNAVYLPGTVDHAGGVAGLSAALNFAWSVQADPDNLVTNALYVSFLLKVPNLGTLNSSSPTYFAGFATNSGDQTFSLPSSAMKIFLEGNSPTSGQSTTWAIGVANNSGSGSAAFDSGGHGTNDVVFVVVDYEFGINGDPDIARLWVNPASASFSAVTAPPATASTAAITGANTIAQAADFFLLDRSGSTLWGGLLVSDLRAGMSWSYVTGGPEITPSTGPILSASTTGGKFILNSVHGAVGATNFLLSSTNLTLPLSNWTVMATNVSDANGLFSLTNTINPAVNQQFYALRTLPVPNALWIPTCGAWLGAACSNGAAAAFSEHEARIGRQVDVLRIYHSPGSWSALSSEELTYIKAGRMLLESVKPSNDWTNAIGVANGGSATVDAQMTSLAQSIASVQPMKIMLIVFHEPENNVTGSVSGADSGTPATYIAMWHNVRSIFDANGATNVIWCWDEQGYAPLRYLTPSLWPGNSYVDWVMWDIYQSSASETFTNDLQIEYNWMTTNSSATNNYLGKPWGVAEWGIGIHSYVPTVADQTNGINELNDALNKYNQFPRLKLVEYFDEGTSALLPGSLPAYSNFASSPYMEQQCSH